MLRRGSGEYDTTINATTPARPTKHMQVNYGTLKRMYKKATYERELFRRNNRHSHLRINKLKKHVDLLSEVVKEITEGRHPKSFVDGLIQERNQLMHDLMLAQNTIDMFSKRKKPY